MRTRISRMNSLVAARSRSALSVIDAKVTHRNLPPKAQSF
jgi:hypothetical protein